VFDSKLQDTIDQIREELQKVDPKELPFLLEYARSFRNHPSVFKNQRQAIFKKLKTTHVPWQRQLLRWVLNVFIALDQSTSGG